MGEGESDLWSAEKEVEHREEVMEKDESDRFACIAEEHRWHHEESDACGDLQYVADLVTKSAPKNLADVVNKTPEAVEDVLRQNWEFFDDYYQKIVDRKARCDHMTQAAAKAHEECEADEETIEAFYC